MNIASHIAKHFREVHFGGNWTWSNLKDSLVDVTWQQATTQVYSFNTIATLVYHVNYYVTAVLQVLEGGPLDASDKFAFDHPPIACQADWGKMLEDARINAEKFAVLVEQLPDSKMWETFVEEKYGNYYRNLHGIIEHTHYHLGQIVIIKKILQQQGGENKESPAA
jgi:hypothetical protein